MCTHRPVLPTVFDALGLADPELEPGEMLVVHHRKGRSWRSTARSEPAPDTTSASARQGSRHEFM